MSFTATFLDAEGAPYLGDGAHRVTAWSVAEAQSLAERMLSTSLSRTVARGFRILNPAGEIVFETPPLGQSGCP